MTPFSLAQRYVGIRELTVSDHPFIQWCFTLCGYGPDTKDEVPWCSAFMQHPFWELRLPRSKSARARSWLTVGQQVDLVDAQIGYDVVILKRGSGIQPGPEDTTAQGHVGLYAGREELVNAGAMWSERAILVLGGNQNNTVSIERYSPERLLGVRRIK